jgi:hypothetical protein
MTNSCNWIPSCPQPAKSRRCRLGEKDRMTSRISYVRAFISWLTVMSSLSSLQAQGAAMARISGTLTNDSGAVLVGATVQAKSRERGSSRSTVTGSEGRVAVADLPIGSYDVRASNPGFDPGVRSDILLTVGADLVIQLLLKVGQSDIDFPARCEAAGITLVNYAR